MNLCCNIDMHAEKTACIFFLLRYLPFRWLSRAFFADRLDLFFFLSEWCCSYWLLEIASGDFFGELRFGRRD